MTRIASRLLTVLAAVLVAVPLAPAGARAQPTSPTLTWAVQPADEKGPDGRRWIEVALDPGQVVTEHLAVRNFSDGPVAFALKAADGYLTDKGRFNMLPSNQESVDGGTWIDVQKSVTVGPKQTKVVPFTITVPRDASPGDHPAGIAATVTSSGGTVAVESRVGFRVMMRATGTVTAALTIGDVAARYERSWNPFSAGTVHVTYTATNGGNVAVTGSGRVTAAELFGLAEPEARTAVEELLPGGSRNAEARVAGVWGLGPVRISVEATPSVLAGDAAGAEIRRGSATVTVWVLPWPQLALVVVLAALVIACRIVVRRRRRRLARLLAQARDEGRAEARGSALTGGSPRTS
ncbi:WxL protein peptidoglycan domain-containing protein [Micromonospora avicenniae]|uniref:WxL protein peptidoglycan domain-containing protein n=1 Tax=Micromonospora avicenniae TaxID=1198245 RepID=UPI003420E389